MNKYLNLTTVKQNKIKLSAFYNLFKVHFVNAPGLASFPLSIKGYH